MEPVYDHLLLFLSCMENEKIYTFNDMFLILYLYHLLVLTHLGRKKTEACGS